MNPTLSQKGLLLLAVPLLLLLLLIGLVFHFEREAVAAERLSVHTKDVVNQAQQVLANTADAQGGVRGYVITRDPAFLAPFEVAQQEGRDDLDRLIHTVRDNEPQTARARAIRDRAEALFAWGTGTVELARAGDGRGAADRVRAGDGERHMTALRRDVQAFLDEEQRLDRDRAAEVERARGRLSTLLTSGAAAAVLSGGLLALAFRRGISGRFAVLVENTRRLATGKELTAPLAGADEIASLDRAFRDMAAELTAASDRLRESDRENRDLYDNAPCGYHSVDATGTVVMMNRAELQWLGYEAAELVGRVRFADVVSPASRAAYEAGFARVREDGGVSDVELELVRRDGTAFPVLINSSAIRGADGRYLRSRTTLTNLTERKRAEDEVRRLNAELEERVRERTADLAEANRELGQKNGEIEMFVYSVSHDLRSPLVNLQGFGKELEKGCQQVAALLADESLPPAVREPATAILDGKMARSLGFIQSAVLRLSGIIEALLRLSRAGRVEYRREAVDVGRVAARVLGAMHATIMERAAEVAVGDLPPAWGDPTAVEQVFANLIGNALAYLDPRRPGRVEVGAVPPAGGHDGFHTYYVRDNGLGIPEAHRGKIFQAFQRAHPQTATGEGIGLTIVARIAERHRGRVWVESEAGVGSTFYVSLPAAPGGRAAG